MRQLKIVKQITNRESASLDKYLQEVGKERRISIEEEVELGIRIRKGDESAVSELIKANPRFVISVAKQYQNRGISLPDLISYGNLGLIKAAGRFDETRGFKFISFAVWWIRQTILQAITENAGIIKLPVNKATRNNRVRKTNLIFTQEMEREPLPHEIASILDLPINMITEALYSSNHCASLDVPFSENEDGNLLDILENKDSSSPERGVIHESLATDIERALDTLTFREKDILCLFYGIKKSREYTLDEIVEILNLTNERVRQIKKKAIERLRHPTRAKTLRQYV